MKSLTLTSAAAGLGIIVSLSTMASGYNPIHHQVQTILAADGYYSGKIDGELGKVTSNAIVKYQKKQGLTSTGQLDAETLAKLGVGVDPAKVKSVIDWRALPTQSELDKILANPINDPAFPFTDYRRNAPAANLDLPGAAILQAMNASADKFGSRAPGLPNHTPAGYKHLENCLVTPSKPTHWSDLTIHYYCQMSLPRRCYTYETSGDRPVPSKSKTLSPRTQAYKECAANKFSYAKDFAVWVVKDQALVFQYVMFGQTHAFNHEQEQAIINAFYGVTDPTDKVECAAKRPRRTEDPTDGTHCLVDKTMTIPLIGKRR